MRLQGLIIGSWLLLKNKASLRIFMKLCTSSMESLRSRTRQNNDLVTPSKNGLRHSDAVIELMELEEGVSKPPSLQNRRKIEFEFLLSICLLLI